MNLTEMNALFEKSRDERRGLTVFLPGHQIAIVVQEIHGTESVAGVNREFDRVVIPMNQIVALAL